MDFESHAHKTDEEGHNTFRPSEHQPSTFDHESATEHTQTTPPAAEHVVDTAPAQANPVVSSWPPAEVSAEPSVPVSFDPPTPPVPSTAPASFAEATPTSPVPVVRVLSPVGVEYVFLTISLFTAATGLAWALLSVVNGKTDFTVLAFPVALLLVSVPLFAFFFLRLKKLELNRPALKLDPSKRRSTQFTQITSFLISMFTVVGMVFSIFAKIGGQSGVSIGKVLLDGLVLLVVFGGLLAYYWRDEHRS